MKRWEKSLIYLVLSVLVVFTLGLTLLNPGQSESVSAKQVASAEKEPFRIGEKEYMGGTVPVDAKKRPVKEFTLTIKKKQVELKDGVPVTVWAFGLEGQENTFPGPELRVKEGDLVRITLKNTHNRPHTIHFHGLTSLAQDMDGVPSTSFEVMPGEQYTYEFVAEEPGSVMYHCHFQTYKHMDHGMYGALIVEPDKPFADYDRDYTLLLDEWDTKQDSNQGKHDPKPDYFLVNGKAYPDTKPLDIPEGEVALINLMNAGYSWHSMHLHGMSFYVVTKDGYPVPEPYKADTLSIGPGERYGILVKGRDGTFPFHDHALKAVTNDGVYPGGMLLLINGSKAKDIHQDRGEHAHEATPMKDGEAGLSTSASTSVQTSSAQEKKDSKQVSSSRESSLASTGSRGDNDPPKRELVVDIANFKFEDANITVRSGTTVTWVNKDTVAHTVNEGKPGGSSDFESGMLQPGESWSYTFNDVGQYSYYCLPHPFMTGKVIVK